MANDNNKKDTDRDFKPTRGQESNENWDDQNSDRADNESTEKTGQQDQNSNIRRTTESTDTTGYGSSQRSKAENVGPLDADLEQLPSEKRKDRAGNLTGPGLG